MRTVHAFHKDWWFHKPGEAPVCVDLPHTWNAEDGQDGGNDYFRGACIYTKRFSRPEGECVFLAFNGAAMICDVALNGKVLAHHEGGYSTFRVELTDALEDENELVGGVQAGFKVNAGEDVHAPRAVPFVRARATSGGLEVGIDGIEVRKRLAKLPPFPRLSHQPGVRGFCFD